jgi:hypothetical protein
MDSGGVPCVCRRRKRAGSVRSWGIPRWTPWTWTRGKTTGAPTLPSPKAFDEIKRLLLSQSEDQTTAITTALRGAGGYGKTTLAKAICHDERIQQAFVEDLIYTLSRERPGFSGIDAATAHLAELLAERDILLVVDDVWDPMHLKPFLQGGKRSARLVTTRNEEVLPVNAQSLLVDGM